MAMTGSYPTLRSTRPTSRLTSSSPATTSAPTHCIPLDLTEQVRSENVERMKKERTVSQIVLEFEPGAFSALRKSPSEFAQEVKTAAVVQWYAEGRISQSKACEILEMSRIEFLDELYRRKVPACQVTIEELREELDRV